jgi:hypothetical protein
LVPVDGKQQRQETYALWRKAMSTCISVLLSSSL